MWLDVIANDLKNPNLEIIEPDAEVTDQDQVVGEVVDPELQRLYSLSAIYIRRANEQRKAALDADNKEKFEKSLKKALELKDKADILKDIFWAVLQDNHDLWLNGVGVRKGWQVVRIEPKRLEIVGCGLIFLPN